jgi:hypothetical protein
MNIKGPLIKVYRSGGKEGRRGRLGGDEENYKSFTGFPTDFR